MFPSITAAAASLRQGKLSPRDLVDACLEQIRRFDGEVQAWVCVDRERAQREADRLSALLAAGEDLGPLHGIPVGVKDIVDVQGLPTEAGSPLLKGRVADEDAPVVACLRQAGAIILGKTVTTEFACLDPAATRNPWNLTHTPGGSSSGSAAAVALHMCFAALGSQTAGSLTRPAAYCGVAALKPTFGVLDLTGVVPISSHLDHLGVIARCTADLGALLTAMQTGQSSATTWTVPDQSPRLHVIEQFFLEQADEDVRGVTEAACERLRQAGAALASLTLPRSFAPVHLMHHFIMAVDAADNHCETFSEHASAYRPKVASLISEGLATMALDYARALRHQAIFRRDMAAVLGADRIAVTPATPTAAPAGLDSTGDPSFNTPWSHAGLPTVTIPCGLTPAGLPCGLQFIGPAHGEAELLRVAGWCEAVLRFEASPPLLRFVGK
jgi:aspartyl-tRNA(Asn)/glutamyl-tRNA(Gln) amidotransferase subunit A